MSDMNSSDDCGGCTLHGRREFLRDAAFAVAALTAVTASAGALPVHVIRAIAVNKELVTYPVPAGDSVNIDKKNEVIVARVGSQLYAFMLACPHQNTALRWNASEHKFQCPKHHSQYKADGTFIDGRATRSMDRFAVKRDGNNLVVDLDKVFEDDRDHAGWMGATAPA
jgi:nitrite reductase/ring-hydroxylating ferredoxin subunit